MSHPADGEAWQDFDRQYPDFAEEARNIRLGLATDGFNPFGNMNTKYSMWPVIVVPYCCQSKPTREQRRATRRAGRSLGH